jgi:hypothetical protein
MRRKDGEQIAAIQITGGEKKRGVNAEDTEIGRNKPYYAVCT